MNTSQFNCSGCGLCCTLLAKKAVDGAKLKKDLVGTLNLNELDKALLNFPYKFTATGACEKFDTETKGCSVYSNRPDVCSVAKSYRKYNFAKVNRKRYYEQNARKCNEMIRENGLDLKYIVPEKYS